MKTRMPYFTAGAIGVLAVAALAVADHAGADHHNTVLHEHDPDIYTLLYEDDTVWVWESRFPPGGRNQPHSHAKPYVVYAATDAHLRLTAEDGSTREIERDGGTYFESQAWSNHWAQNLDGENEARFIVIQPK